MVPTGRHGAEYTMLPTLLLLNNNLNAALFYKETVRASGTVPREHTVGQRRLTVQLAVGSQRTLLRTGRDLL